MCDRAPILTYHVGGGGGGGARDSPASRRRRFSFSERTLCVCCVSAFLTKDKLRLLKRLMMNLAAAAPARGVLLMQPVGEVREAFSTREIYGLGVFDAPGF
jgi:hypothetical protein